MQTLLLLLPVFLSAATIASSKFIEAHTKDVIDPYVLLEKFILLPKQDKVRNEGRFGKAKITLKHNVQNATLWILGIDSPIDEIDEYTKQPLCSKLIDKASFAVSTARYFDSYSSNTNTDKDSDVFRYKEKFKIVNDKSYTNDTNIKYNMTYWLILNCFHPTHSCVTFEERNLNGRMYDVCAGSPEYTVGPLHYSLKAHWTNAEGGIEKELSFDEIGFPEINIVFMSVHFVLLIYAYVVQKVLSRNDIQHHTANLLFVICSLTPIKYLFGMWYWLDYTQSGQYDKLFGMWVFSKILESIITSATVCLFAFLASGWSIFRRKLPVINRLRLAFFVSSYLVLSIACVIWVAVVYKHKLDFILYHETDPGIVMMVLLALCGIRYNILCHSVEKKFSIAPMFFQRLRIMGSIYMFAQPLMVLFLRADSAGAYRGKTMEAWWSIITFFCQVIFLVLYDPRIFKKTFPFHAFVNEMKISTVDENNKSVVQLSSLSGGTAALQDEDGRVRALNTFDKIHLARLKDVAKAFDTEIQLLNASHAKFQDLMDQVATENLVSLGYNYDSAMSWGGIEEENRLARFVPEDEDVEDEDVAVRHTPTASYTRGDDPQATLNRPFRPLSKPQRELSRVNRNGQDVGLSYSPPKEPRFNSFEERQSFRDRNEGKDIKIGKESSMSAIQRALDEATAKNKHDSFYTGKLEASGAQSEIIGLKRDPDRNNKKNDRENDDNKSRADAKRSESNGDGEDEKLADRVLSSTKKKKPTSGGSHK